MNDDIFYTDTGKGPPVIFIHGYCETHSMWDPAVRKLSKSFRVLTLDLPGFGMSPLPDTLFSLTDIAEKIHGLLEKNDVHHPVLIGHSLGGYVTLAYAKKHEMELRGFGLFHSSAFADTPDKKLNRTKLIEFIANNGTDSFVRTFIPSLFYEKRRKELESIIELLTEEALNTPPKTIQEYARAMRDREENIELIKTFTKPVMMIIGENDGSIPLEKSLEQSKMIQRPYALTLKETAHMGMFERSVESLNHIQNFLNVC